MKPFLKIMLILCFSLLLSSCGEWDNLVDSVSGSDDEETNTAQSDLPRKDVSKPGTNTDKPKDSGSKDEPKGEFSHQSTYTSYGVRNGGRQAWRIPKKGPEFGRKIKVVFSDGHTVLVNDTSHNYRESDGFVFKPGIGPNGEGENDTGTAHGGVYLHAPYGNRSRQVTFYY